MLTTNDWESEAIVCEGIAPTDEPTVSGAEVAANVIYEEVRPPWPERTENPVQCLGPWVYLNPQIAVDTSPHGRTQGACG